MCNAAVIIIYEMSFVTHCCCWKREINIQSRINFQTQYLQHETSKTARVIKSSKFLYSILEPPDKLSETFNFKSLATRLKTSKKLINVVWLNDGFNCLRRSFHCSSYNFHTEWRRLFVYLCLKRNTNKLKHNIDALCLPLNYSGTENLNFISMCTTSLCEIH